MAGQYFLIFKNISAAQSFHDFGEDDKCLVKHLFGFRTKWMYLTMVELYLTMMETWKLLCCFLYNVFCLDLMVMETFDNYRIAKFIRSDKWVYFTGGCFT